MRSATALLVTHAAWPELAKSGVSTNVAMAENFKDRHRTGKVGILLPDSIAADLHANFIEKAG